MKADYEEYSNPEIVVRNLGKSRDWPFWFELHEFCAKTGVMLKDFVVDLRFDLLD